MSKFMGGSAFSMARDIAEGFCTVNERTLRSMTAADMNGLSHELDRHLRELRGASIANAEQTEVQARNRRIMRLNSALVVMRAFRTKVRR